MVYSGTLKLYKAYNKKFEGNEFDLINFIEDEFERIVEPKEDEDWFWFYDLYLKHKS